MVAYFIVVNFIRVEAAKSVLPNSPGAPCVDFNVSVRQDLLKKVFNGMS